ncbi:MAG: hypothetical protein RID53_08675 [Coleofasciculus sp. B1-GNL1-01]|uniref:hypothetical protein n=1 Tax=Coleofasciculus sp. B1-GNL1-01 TaxID=3068484 RepID=UPI0033031D9E
MLFWLDELRLWEGSDIDGLVQLGDMAVEPLLFGATATGDGRGWVGNRFVAPLAVFPPLVPTQGTC